MQSAQESRALGHDRRAFVALLRLRSVSSRIIYSSASHDASMSSTVSIVDNDGKNLDADLIQDPEQILELEFIHAVPKDPVLETMFRYISSHVHQKHVATYLKLIFVKLAAVHAMKETDKKEADLVLALQALELDPAKCIIYTREGPARKAYKACRALAQNHKRVSKHSAIKLRRFIYDSGVRIPQVYHRTNLDDLSAV
jgi:hypothetical protein